MLMTLAPWLRLYNQLWHSINYLKSTNIEVTKLSEFIYQMLLASFPCVIGSRGICAALL